MSKTSNTAEYLERGAEAEALRVAFELLAEKDEISGEDVMDILDRIDAGEALSHLETVDRAVQADNMCDACAGTGIPLSGGQCMCGGSGKMSDAAVYLREQLVSMGAKLRRLKEESDALTSTIDEFDVDAPYNSLDAITRRHYNICAVLAETEIDK